MFLTIEDMQQFINICWANGSNPLKKNMFGNKKTWKFEANGFENDLQFDDFVLRGTVRFSQSDIPKIIKAFQKYCSSLDKYSSWESNWTAGNGSKK